MTELACFGFVTCFDYSSDTCKACEKVAECQQRCYSALRTYDTTIGNIKPLLKKHERWANALGNDVETDTSVRERFEVELDSGRIQGLSKTAVTIAKASMHSYVNFSNLTDEFVSSIRPNYLRIMLSHFITGVVNTSALRKAIESELEWQTSTAKSYACAFIELLVHWKLVTRLKRGEYQVL